MPSFACKCGETLRYGEIPNPIEYVFISDSEYDKISGMLDSEDLYRQMKSFLKCPICKRLWFFWGGFDKDPVEYMPQVQD